jgi:hypothetical protein
MKDLCLDLNLHDLKINSQLHDLTIVSEKDYLIQKIKIKLLFIYGEWFLNVDDGLKYYEIIWVKTPNLPLIESAIKATILEIPEVISLTRFSMNLELRTLTLFITMNTIYGTISLEEAL